MILSRLLPARFTSTLVITLMTLQLSGCGFEDVWSAIIPDAGLDGSTVAHSNRAAKISGVDTGSVIEDVDPDGDDLLEVEGKLNISDEDSGEDAFVAEAVKGVYGDIEINNSGNWRYAASNQQKQIQDLTSNATLSDKLTVSSVDGTTHTVEITIIGVVDTGNANNVAIISGNDSGDVTEDDDAGGDDLLITSGKLNIFDSDDGESEFIIATINGNYGNLDIGINGNWFYGAFNNLPAVQNLDTNETLTDKLIVSSVDGTTHEIIITIQGLDEVNQPAIISGTDSGSVTEDVDPDNDNQLETSGTLNITDSDAGEAAFIATTINGNIGNLIINNSGGWNYSVNNNLTTIQNLNTGVTLTENIVVSSVDGTTHTVVITINGANEVNNSTTINLSWVAPSEREDNQPISLSEIAGYKIYYGTSSGQYTSNVTITNSTSTGHAFTNFPAGTHYFVLTTIDTEGRESMYSNETSIN